MFQKNSRGGGEEGLLLLSPGEQCGAGAWLQNAKTFAQGFGEIREKHDAEAAGQDVVGSVGKGERRGIGFAEFDVGEALFASELFGKRDHARAHVRGGYTPRGANRGGDRKSRIAHAAGKIENTHARTKLGRFEDGIGGAARESCNLGMPFSPCGDSSFAGPLLAKIFANHVNLCRVGGWGRGTHTGPHVRESVAE